MYVDSHAHVNFEIYENVEDILKEACKCNVQNIVNCAEDLKTSYEVINLHNTYPNLYPAVGIHPQNVDVCTTDDIIELEKILCSENVIALGEIGLDFYYSRENRKKHRLKIRLMHSLLHTELLKVLKTASLYGQPML